MKRLARRAKPGDMVEGVREATRAVLATVHGADATAGFAAFEGPRPPIFANRHSVIAPDEADTPLVRILV